MPDNGFLPVSSQILAMIFWFFRNEVQISGFPQYFQSIHPEFILLKDAFFASRCREARPGPEPLPFSALHAPFRSRFRFVFWKYFIHKPYVHCLPQDTSRFIRKKGREKGCCHTPRSSRKASGSKQKHENRNAKTCGHHAFLTQLHGVKRKIS